MLQVDCNRLRLESDLSLLRSRMYYEWTTELGRINVWMVGTFERPAAVLSED